MNAEPSSGTPPCECWAILEYTSLQAWDLYPHIPLVRVPLKPYAAFRRKECSTGRKHKKNNHNHQIHIMLYDSECAALTKLCEKEGLNMSTLLRKRIMKTTIPERPNFVWRPLTERINALGKSSTRLPVPYMNTEPPQSMLSKPFLGPFSAYGSNWN